MYKIKDIQDVYLKNLVTGETMKLDYVKSLEVDFNLAYENKCDKCCFGCKETCMHYCHDKSNVNVLCSNCKYSEFAIE